MLQKLLRQVRKGARLVFVPGNHDEGLRAYVGLRFGGVEIHQDIVHTTAKGRRYNVMHGDQFDVIVRTARWLAFLGDETKRRGLDGVICGHIHHGCDRTFGGIHYLNCGDWVESCTAIVETMDGDLRLVHWPDCPPTRMAETTRAPLHFCTIISRVAIWSPCRGYRFQSVLRHVRDFGAPWR